MPLVEGPLRQCERGEHRHDTPAVHDERRAAPVGERICIRLERRDGAPHERLGRLPAGEGRAPARFQPAEIVGIPFQLCRRLALEFAEVAFGEPLPNFRLRLRIQELRGAAAAQEGRTGDLVRGRESVNNLSGPVGIVSAISQAASYGLADLLELLVLITVNLGVFNLLPIPALDGGRLVFLAVEAVIRRPVSQRLQEHLTMATFILLFGLMIFATYNDILRLFTGAL